jgi:hypothetical protein
VLKGSVTDSKWYINVWATIETKTSHQWNEDSSYQPERSQINPSPLQPEGIKAVSDPSHQAVQRKDGCYTVYVNIVPPI